MDYPELNEEASAVDMDALQVGDTFIYDGIKYTVVRRREPEHHFHGSHKVYPGFILTHTHNGQTLYQFAAFYGDWTPWGIGESIEDALFGELMRVQEIETMRFSAKV